MLLSARTAVYAVLLVSAASPVLAQVQAPRPRPSQNMTASFGASPSESHDRFTREVIGSQQGREAVSEERAALIDRVGPLVAEGRCDEARRIAREEGDRALSRRIGSVCIQGRPTPMPAAEAD
jgi:hypothetical protein